MSLNTLIEFIFLHLPNMNFSRNLFYSIFFCRMSAVASFYGFKETIPIMFINNKTI